MADRILKPDSGNDLVLQNDDGSAKIEINENGTVVATPSLQVDNLLINGNEIASQNNNGNINLVPEGSGNVNIQRVDIDSGTIDGTDVTVGAGKTLDVSAGTFTTSTAQKQAIVDGSTIEAQDLASGSGTSLPNNVQDAITRLGTVTNGTFNSSIGASATFPAGKIVGHTAVQMQQTTQVTSAGSIAELDTDLRLTYTAKSSSNKLLFQVYAWFCSPNSNHLSWSYIWNVTDSAKVNGPTADGSRKSVHWAKRVSAYDPNDFNDMNYMVFADAPSGAKTYTIYYGTEGKSDQFYESSLSSNSGVNAPITFSILEIQQ